MVGLEPTTTVLETVILPLKLHLCDFMNGLFSAGLIGRISRNENLFRSSIMSLGYTSMCKLKCIFIC